MLFYIKESKGIYLYIYIYIFFFSWVWGWCLGAQQAEVPKVLLALVLVAEVLVPLVPSRRGYCYRGAEGITVIEVVAHNLGRPWGCGGVGRGDGGQGVA